MVTPSRFPQVTETQIFPPACCGCANPLPIFGDELLLALGSPPPVWQAGLEVSWWQLGCAKTGRGSKTGVGKCHPGLEVAVTPKAGLSPSSPVTPRPSRGAESWTELATLVLR